VGGQIVMKPSGGFFPAIVGIGYPGWTTTDIRRRNGVIAISLRSKIGWAPPAQPGEEILSTVPISDAALPLGEAVQSNTGNFIDLGLGDASTVAKNVIQSVSYGPILYAS
jgi:hypothetical protein